MSIALHSVACCGVGAIVRIAFVVTFHELLSGEESSLVQNARESADLDEWLRTSMSGAIGNSGWLPWMGPTMQV